MSGLVRLWYGTTTLRREICLLTPLAALLVAYFAVMAPSHVHTAAVMKDWGGPGGKRPWVNKIRNLRYGFMGFDRQVTMSTLILFAACTEKFASDGDAVFCRPFGMPYTSLPHRLRSDISIVAWSIYRPKDVL